VLTQEEFLALVKAAGSDFYPPDDEQAKAVYADPGADLFIVAGPGTGKTSCLSFRALYLIFVAGLTPRSIVATTFTRKAAAELRSRVLGWGYRMIDAAGRANLGDNKLEFLKAIDLNQILTGTIDSLAETILREHRSAGEEPPVLADEYVTRTIMARSGLLGSGLYFSKSLNDLLLAWRGSAFRFNFSSKVDLLCTIADRRHNDLVDIGTFAKLGPLKERKGRSRIVSALTEYDAAILDAGVLSSGGRERLGSISKQGDRYLRSLFVAGALAVIHYAKLHGSNHRPWLTALLARRPTKVAAIALANKLARMAWALMARGERYNYPVALRP
jgi:UvrD/REP helicase N-terminal domain/Transposase IS116/IS110/IS902 family